MKARQVEENEAEGSSAEVQGEAEETGTGETQRACGSTWRSTDEGHPAAQAAADETGCSGYGRPCEVPILPIDRKSVV